MVLRNLPINPKINPLTLFIYGIFAKWYLIVTASALMVVYYVLKGLDEAGIIEYGKQIVIDVLRDSESIAKYCVPKIANLKNFWSCLENIEAYRNK